MPRLQLDLPDRFTFTTQLVIYSEHINTGRHLDNARTLGLVAEARARYFASMGYTESAVEGLSTTVADVLWIYRSEAFYGDELVFEAAARDFNKYGFDLVYRVTCKGDGREIGRGKNGMVFIQSTSRKVSPVPEEFIRRAGNAEAPYRD